jgi:hypothetical protein
MKANQGFPQKIKKKKRVKKKEKRKKRKKIMYRGPVLGSYSKT